MIVPVVMDPLMVRLLDLLAMQGPGETRSAQVREAVRLLGEVRLRQLEVLEGAGDLRAARQRLEMLALRNEVVSEEA